MSNNHTVCLEHYKASEMSTAEAGNSPHLCHPAPLTVWNTCIAIVLLHWSHFEQKLSMYDVSDAALTLG